MRSSATASVDIEKPGALPPSTSGFDRFFRISERGSSVAREIRGGLATFFAMAYIIVLNPIILGSGVDKYGHHLDNGQLVTATALTAALTTLLMGVIGNVPIALAAGLGINSVVALQLAPKMSWPDAMGMVVLAGIAIMVLVATGLRERVMSAVPLGLRKAIAIGIGLFIFLIGLVDSGFVSRIPDAAHTTVPLQLGTGGHLDGWPVLVFVLGALLTLALIIRRVPGAILISIVAMTVLALIVEAAAKLPADSWGLTVPKWPGNPVATPDFGLVGDARFHVFDVLGWGAAIGLILTVLMANFFDAMGTALAVGREADLVDEEGRLPQMRNVLIVESAGAIAGGAASASSNTIFVESTAGAAQGAKTGLANMVTGVLFLLAMFLAPIVGIIPSAATGPALVVVGALMISQVSGIDWNDMGVAVPAFATIALMPFTYSIANGVGAGVVLYVLIAVGRGRWREVHPLLAVVGAFFVWYFLRGVV